MKTALVIGATGLVGRQLVEQLLAHDSFSRVRVFGRRPWGRPHPKLEEHLVNFDRPGDWRAQVQGDVLFSTLGTTIKKAGSKAAQYRIDHNYQYETARSAAEGGVPVYVLVSSAGASEHSRIFYSRMKGELERDVRRLPFRAIHILRPGILQGARQEFRLGERVGIALMSVLGRIGPLRPYRPIDAALVARAMIHAALSEESGVFTYTLEEVFQRAQS